MFCFPLEVVFIVYFLPAKKIIVHLMRTRMLSLFLLFVICCAGGGSARTNEAQDYSRKFAALMRSTKAADASAWDRSYLDKSIRDRIRPATPEILEYIEGVNRLDGFAVSTSPMEINAETKRKIAGELEKLPPKVLELIKKRVIGIFTVQNLGGSALTGCAYGKNGSEFGFIILDMNMLNKPANEWITLKENTVFAPETGWKLDIKIENDETNTKESAVVYIFLHELGHIVHDVYKVLPPLAQESKDFSDFEFSGDVWLNELQPRREISFVYQEILAFYGRNPPFSVQIAPEIYRSLEKTPWATLYGATNANDDFAEFFVSYVHGELQNKPYRITVKRNEAIAYTGINGLKRNNAGERYRIIAGIFDRL